MRTFDETTWGGTRGAIRQLTGRIPAILWSSAGVSLLLAALFAFLGAELGTWQYYAVAAAAAILTLLSAIAATIVRRGRTNLGTWLFIDGLLIFLPVLSASIEGIGLILGVVGVLTIPFLAQATLPGKTRQRAIYVGIFVAISALLIDLFMVTPRIPNPLPDFAVYAVNLLFVGLLVAVLARQFSHYRIRTKLILTFLAVSVVPMALITFLNDRGTRAALEQEANDKLFSAAAQTASSLDTFMQSNLAMIRTQAQIHAFEEYMSLPASERRDAPIEEEALELLAVHTLRDPVNIHSYALLDLRGRNILDTRPEDIGRDESDRLYFRTPLETLQPYASAVEVSPHVGLPALYFSSIVEGPNGNPVGVLRVRILAESLQAIMVNNAGQAGEGSFGVLFDDAFIHLAHSTAPETIMKAVGPLSAEVEADLKARYRLPDLPPEQLTTNLPDLVEKLAASSENPFFEAEDVATGDKINQVAVARMSTQPWLVAYFQPQEILFAPAAAQTRNALLLAVIFSAAVSGLAVFGSQLLAEPITRLTKAAQQIGEGDLKATAPIESQDEIGLLAKTFNLMTDRLRSLILGLEERVAERTEDLQRRAQQLQAAAEISQRAASIRDVDELLDEAVQLISQRFGFYHAGIFLVDDEGEHAVLRAASSEGGQKMLERGHRLAVGKVGLVGYVTGTGRPRVALDVGMDAVHFANPDLPQTRSELAVPLQVGDRIIGALDVQSDEPNAFDEQDSVVLQAIADQLSIAIENASLISRQSELAVQRRRAIDVYRQLTGHLSYDQILANVSRLIRGTFGYDRVTLALVEGNEVVIRSASARTQAKLPRLGQGVPIGQGVLGLTVSQRGPVILSAAEQGQSPRMDPALGQIGTALAVPLISRGQAIGTLAVERESAPRFTADDVELVELLASQVAVSIENARLFEETQHSLRQVNALYRRQTAEAWEVLANARRTQGRENESAYVPNPEVAEARANEPAIEASISLRGEVIGKLDLIPQQPGEWNEEDIEILQEVASELAGHLEQLRLVEEIQRRATQLETAAEIARVATGLLDMDALIARSVRLIQERFGFYHVSLYLLDESGEVGQLRDASGEGAEALRSARPRFEVGSRHILGFSARTGEYYVAHDTSTDPFFQPNPALPDTRSELGVPMKIGERMIGVLDVHDSGPYAFSEDDIAALEALADQLAVAVENARLFAEAVSRARREQAVVEITGKIRASSDIDTILRTAVQEMRSALGAKRAAIRLAPGPSEAAESQPPPESDGRGEVSDNLLESNGREAEE